MSDDAALPDRSPLETMLCFDVYAVNLAFGRIYKPLLEPLGLTYPQFLVMITLWTKNGQSVGRIGERLGLDSSTLTPLIKRLEAANLVTRQRDADDERRVIVSLTPQGAQLEQQRDHVLECVTLATGLDPKQMHDLSLILQTVRAKLNQR